MLHPVRRLIAIAAPRPVSCFLVYSLLAPTLARSLIYLILPPPPLPNV